MSLTDWVLGWFLVQGPAVESANLAVAPRRIVLHDWRRVGGKWLDRPTYGKSFVTTGVFLDGFLRERRL